MAQKKPLRTTTRLDLTFNPDVAELIQHNASQLGYTVSEYMAILAKGQEVVARPAAQNQANALIRMRIADAIRAMLNGRDQDEVIALLRDGIRISTDADRPLIKTYLAAIKAQNQPDNWGELEHEIDDEAAGPIR
jgi:uncharacterized protein (DUF1778 family)